MIFTSQGITIGSLMIHYYGIIIMSGAVAGGFLAGWNAKKRGHNPDLVWDLLVWLIVGGVIGARLWHILTPSPSLVDQGVTTLFYLTHPLDAIAVWKGGLGIFGAIVGGVAALYFYTKRHGLNFFEWADIAAPSLALGQSIGRWGNYFNQELYGAPTNLPWKLFIEPQYRHSGYINVEYYHPLFLYESIWCLANMGLLLWVNKKYQNILYKGDILLMYLIAYPIGRFFLEFLRLDSSQVWGLNINQDIMAIVAVISAIALFLRHFKTTKVFTT